MNYFNMMRLSRLSEWIDRRIRDSLTQGTWFKELVKNTITEISTEMENYYSEISSMELVDGGGKIYLLLPSKEKIDIFFNKGITIHDYPELSSLLAFRYEVNPEKEIEFIDNRSVRVYAKETFYTTETEQTVIGTSLVSTRFFCDLRLPAKYVPNPYAYDIPQEYIRTL